MLQNEAMEDNEEADVSPQKGRTEPSNGLNLSLLMRMCGHSAAKEAGATLTARTRRLRLTAL